MKNQELKIHKTAAKYILGENINTSIKGNKQQLECLENLLESSKKLYTALNNENTSLDTILELVNEKNNNAESFLNLTGINWKL